MDFNVLVKMQRYCTYQERTEEEVYKKLASFGVNQEDNQAIFEQLRSERYFDDERFTEIYVRSKLWQKWSKNKIRAELKKKKIPETLIQKHLASIDVEENRENLIKIATAWIDSNKKENDIPIRLYRYLYSKGFEVEDILDILETLKTLNYNR
jgi:regulatory protein